MSGGDALAARFFETGWVELPEDPRLLAWLDAARPVADAVEADPALRDRWLRCGGTWFAGVNVFPNGPDGGAAALGLPPLDCAAVDFIARHLGLSGFAWDRAQLSICYPGYPRPWAGEDEAAFGFRLRRDAAHLDGLLRDGARRRHVGERHGFILGLALEVQPADAAPFAVWEGSHELLRRALSDRLAGIAPGDWAHEDVTETYVAARREVFARCRRVEVQPQPGRACLTHRLALHGVAPWTAPDGPPRRILYFRPDPFPDASPQWWLEAP